LKVIAEEMANMQSSGVGRDIAEYEVLSIASKTMVNSLCSIWRKGHMVPSMFTVENW